MRLDQLLSKLKYTTRSKATAYLKNNNIIVNQVKIVDPKFQVFPNKDVILINSEKLFYKDPLNLMIYKPKGFLSANKDNYHQVVTKLLKEPEKRFDFFIAGRLDLDSEGLLILTTNGEFAHQIMSPKMHLKKVYQVTLDKTFVNDEQLINGVTIKDGFNNDYLAKAIKINKIHDKMIEITIDEGKFHQVKRMLKAVGYEVINLKRIKIGKLELGNLKPGSYQEFEVEDLL